MDITGLPQAFGKQSSTPSSQPQQRNEDSQKHRNSEPSARGARGIVGGGKRSRGRGRGRGGILGGPIVESRDLVDVGHDAQSAGNNSPVADPAVGSKRPHPKSSFHQNDSPIPIFENINNAYAQRKASGLGGVANRSDGRRGGSLHPGPTGLFKESYCEDPWRHLTQRTQSAER